MYRFLLLLPGTWVKTVSSESRNERLNMLFHCVLCKCMVWIEIFPSIWTQRNHKYLAFSSVRTVCYGTSFFSARIWIRAEKTRSVTNSTELEVGKWEVCITTSKKHTCKFLHWFCFGFHQMRTLLFFLAGHDQIIL